MNNEDNGGNHQSFGENRKKVGIKGFGYNFKKVKTKRKPSPSHLATTQQSTDGASCLAVEAERQDKAFLQPKANPSTVGQNSSVLNSSEHLPSLDGSSIPVPSAPPLSNMPSKSPEQASSIPVETKVKLESAKKSNELIARVERQFLPMAVVFLIASVAVLFVTISPITPSQAISFTTRTLISKSFRMTHQPELVLEPISAMTKNNFTVSTVRAPFLMTNRTISTALEEGLSASMLSPANKSVSHNTNSKFIGGTIEEHSVAGPSVNYSVKFKKTNKFGQLLLSSLFNLCCQNGLTQENSSYVSKASTHVKQLSIHVETSSEIRSGWIFSWLIPDIISKVIHKSMILLLTGCLPAPDVPPYPRLPHPLKYSQGVGSPLKELERYKTRQQSLVPLLFDRLHRLSVQQVYKILDRIFVTVLSKIEPQKFSTVMECEAQKKSKALLVPEFSKPLQPLSNINFVLTSLQPYISSVTIFLSSFFYMAISHQTEVFTVSSFWDLESIVQPVQFSSPHRREPFAEGEDTNILYCTEPSSSDPWLQWDSFYWKGRCKNDVKKLLLMSDSPEYFSCGLYEVFLCMWNFLLAWAFCHEIYRTSTDHTISMKGVDLFELQLTSLDQLGLYPSLVSSCLHCQTWSLLTMHPCAHCLYQEALKSWYMNFICSKSLKGYSIGLISLSRIKHRESCYHTLYIARNKISHPFQGNGPGRGTCGTFWSGLHKSNSDSSQATEQERDGTIFHNQRKEHHFYWVAKARGGRNVKKKIFRKYCVHRNWKKLLVQSDFQNNTRKKDRETCGHRKQTSSWLAVQRFFMFRQPQIRPRHHSGNAIAIVIALSSFIAGVDSSSQPYYSTVMRDSLLSCILELFQCVSPEVILVATVLILLLSLIIALCRRGSRNHLQQSPNFVQDDSIGLSELETRSHYPSNLAFSSTDHFTNQPVPCTTCKSSQTNETGEKNDREAQLSDSKKEKLSEHTHKFVGECNQQRLEDSSSFVPTCNTIVVTENKVQRLSGSASITYILEDVLNNGTFDRESYPLFSLAVTAATDEFRRRHGLVTQRVDSDVREGSFMELADEWDEPDEYSHTPNYNSVSVVSETTYQPPLSVMVGPILPLSLIDHDYVLPNPAGSMQSLDGAICSNDLTLHYDNAPPTPAEGVQIGGAICYNDFTLNNDDAPPTPAEDVQIVGGAICSNDFTLHNDDAPPIPAEDVHIVGGAICSNDFTLHNDNAPPTLAEDVQIVGGAICSNDFTLHNDDAPPTTAEVVLNMSGAMCSDDFTLQCQCYMKSRVANVEPQPEIFIFEDFVGDIDSIPVDDGLMDEAPREELSCSCVSDKALYKPFVNQWGQGSPDLFFDKH